MIETNLRFRLWRGKNKNAKFKLKFDAQPLKTRTLAKFINLNGKMSPKFYENDKFKGKKWDF